MTNAVDLARDAGVDPKRFRNALRQANFHWHAHNDRWVVASGSAEHLDMQRVLADLPEAQHHHPRSSARTESARPSQKGDRDEAYVIGLCDRVLGQRALRQHRFTFLLGDPDERGHRRPLPVDAYYPNLMLVVEYHERQHTERVNFFDNRSTLSGMPRGEQRRRYDAYRREILPAHGLSIVWLSFRDFSHSTNKRLLRTADDLHVVKHGLRAYL